MDSKVIITAIFLIFAIVIGYLLATDTVDITSIIMRRVKHEAQLHLPNWGRIWILKPAPNSYWPVYYNGEYYYTYIIIETNFELKYTPPASTSFPLLAPPAPTLLESFEDSHSNTIHYIYKIELKTNKINDYVVTIYIKVNDYNYQTITFYPYIVNIDDNHNHSNSNSSNNTNNNTDSSQSNDNSNSSNNNSSNNNNLDSSSQSDSNNSNTSDNTTDTSNNNNNISFVIVNNTQSDDNTNSQDNNTSNNNYVSDLMSFVVDSQYSAFLQDESSSLLASDVIVTDSNNTSYMLYLLKDYYNSTDFYRLLIQLNQQNILSNFVVSIKEFRDANIIYYDIFTVDFTVYRIAYNLFTSTITSVTKLSVQSLQSQYTFIVDSVAEDDSYYYVTYNQYIVKLDKQDLSVVSVSKIQNTANIVVNDNLSEIATVVYLNKLLMFKKNADNTYTLKEFDSSAANYFRIGKQFNTLYVLYYDSNTQTYYITDFDSLFNNNQQASVASVKMLNSNYRLTNDNQDMLTTVRALTQSTVLTFEKYDSVFNTYLQITDVFAYLYDNKVYVCRFTNNQYNNYAVIYYAIIKQNDNLATADIYSTATVVNILSSDLFTCTAYDDSAVIDFDEDTVADAIVSVAKLSDINLQATDVNTVDLNYYLIDVSAEFNSNFNVVYSDFNLYMLSTDNKIVQLS